LAGKTLVVWPEQGFGDYIQFARYFPLLKQRGLARLTVCCSAILAPLLRTAEGVDAVISEDADLGDHDYWTFPLSLALRCKAEDDLRLDTIPARLPYLHALPERSQRWQPELEKTGFKVGLVWKGAAGHKNDAHRSLPSLEVLAPLWDAPNVHYFSLQKGQGESEAEAAAAAGHLVHLGATIADLGDTAAIVAQLDLVICVDTAIAHIAGALGKRCWVLLPALGCDWRWYRERGDSPWYPGVMRLFRQRQSGEWSETIALMATALRTLAEGSVTSK
jgi:ADP-heptose:LPS heptosyltransferase